ncbi:MAG: NAD-dependent epimerase/dehydratase family protein [Planctomycetes bacterium]|nr:NAD-dependent epimerase/dehydratase family protein [Planctomycetota bacterium]
MAILVTGATGFIGSHLAEALVRGGGGEEEVRCLARQTSRRGWLEAAPVRWCVGSVEEEASLRAALVGCREVYHLAGITLARDAATFLRVNGDGTRALLAACRAACPGVERVVVMTSLAAAGPSPDGHPLDEGEPARPVSGYGASKGAAEAWVRDFARELPITVIRPPVVYGPREHELLTVFQMAQHGLTVLGDRGKTTSIVHVTDLVAGCIAAARAPAAAGRTYFLSNEMPLAHERLMELLAAAVGRRTLAVRLPDRVLRWAAGWLEDAGALVGKLPALTRDKAVEVSQHHWVCSPARAARDFGWRARIDIAAGMAETGRWYREQGWIR